MPQTRSQVPALAIAADCGADRRASRPPWLAGRVADGDSGTLDLDPARVVCRRAAAGDVPAIVDLLAADQLGAPRDGRSPTARPRVRASHAHPGTRSISPAPRGPIVTGRPLESADPGTPPAGLGRPAHLSGIAPRAVQIKGVRGGL